MTTADYWFAVGFIAGEGHIGFHKNDTKHGGAISISVNQVEDTPLLELKRILGGVLTGPHATEHKPRWTWRAYGGCAAGIIMTLITGLKKVHIQRYEQAITTIKAWRGRPLPNGAKTYCPSGHEYSQENTYIMRNGGGRQCLTCRRSYYVARRARLNNNLEGE